MDPKPSSMDIDGIVLGMQMTLTGELEQRSKYIHAHIEQVMRWTHQGTERNGQIAEAE
jgi:hypothetical protein